jgi:hypothetical protein
MTIFCISDWFELCPIGSYESQLKLMELLKSSLTVLPVLSLEGNFCDDLTDSFARSRRFTAAIVLAFW